ncbi:MAG TPA: Uma2 family endonuclease, partial [Verrucomicrobiae bacterium]|nr:Uma2 family endonuclease [Verrucomicrobiae bacterium]
ALGVGEVWRYDGEVLKIDLLEGADYIPANQSRALPILTSEILTDFLRRMREAGDFQALLEFDEWIQKSS